MRPTSRRIEKQVEARGHLSVLMLRSQPPCCPPALIGGLAAVLLLAGRLRSPGRRHSFGVRHIRSGELQDVERLCARHWGAEGREDGGGDPTVLAEEVRSRAVRGPASWANGRKTIKVTVPRGAKKATARVRIVSVTKRGRKTRASTLAAGAWRTVTFTRSCKVAKVAPVKANGVLAVTPPTDSTPGSVQLTGSSAKIEPNQVIALGITEKTPEGLLARVTDVSATGGGATATVVPSRISDVVPAGQLDLNIPAATVARSRAASSPTKTPKLLQCSSGRSATASALADISAGVKLSAGWAGGSFYPPELPHLKADVTGTVNARLEGEISLDGQASCTLAPQKLFPTPIRLAVFTVVVGPVPIPVVIDGQVTLTGSAEASGSLSSGIKASASAQAGATYEDGKLTPHQKFEKSFTYQPPTVNGSGEAQVALSPVVGVRLAGAAGPEIDLTGGLKLSGNLRPPAGEPWWKLTAPVSLGARFSFALWGLEVNSPRYQLWGEEPVIAQADVGSAPGSSIVDNGTAPEPLPQGVRTRLTWDSDTDVDLHTWNQNGSHAYFDDLEAIDGGYLDQDVIPGYGPETFYETDPSLGNRFTFGICQYNGENANVTVDVRDPDGRTRRFTVSLRGRKAAALLTTSPAGIAPYIDDDASWCSNGDDPTALGQTTTGTFEN